MHRFSLISIFIPLPFFPLLIPFIPLYLHYFITFSKFHIVCEQKQTYMKLHLIFMTYPPKDTICKSRFEHFIGIIPTFLLSFLTFPPHSFNIIPSSFHFFLLSFFLLAYTCLPPSLSLCIITWST